MFRLKPDIAVVVGTLFVVPAERITARLCRLFIKPDRSEVPSPGLDTHLGRALALVRDNRHVISGVPKSALKRDIMDAIVRLAIVRENDIGTGRREAL